MDFVPASLSTLESISRLLQGDDKVKLAGIDADGMLRGLCRPIKSCLKTFLPPFC